MITVRTIYLILLPTYASFFLKKKFLMHTFTYYPYTTRYVAA